MSAGQAVRAERAAWRREVRHREVRRMFPTPGVRAWGAAGVVLAAAGVLSQAFEAVTR